MMTFILSTATGVALLAASVFAQGNNTTTVTATVATNATVTAPGVWNNVTVPVIVPTGYPNATCPCATGGAGVQVTATCPCAVVPLLTTTTKAIQQTTPVVVVCPGCPPGVISYRPTVITSVLPATCVGCPATTTVISTSIPVTATGVVATGAAATTSRVTAGGAAFTAVVNQYAVAALGAAAFLL